MYVQSKSRNEINKTIHRTNALSAEKVLHLLAKSKR